jgi:Zn-dependent membrane protease YugP
MKVINYFSYAIALIVLGILAYNYQLVWIGILILFGA